MIVTSENLLIDHSSFSLVNDHAILVEGFSMIFKRLQPFQQKWLANDFQSLTGHGQKMDVRPTQRSSPWLAVDILKVLWIFHEGLSHILMLLIHLVTKRCVLGIGVALWADERIIGLQSLVSNGTTSRNSNQEDTSIYLRNDRFNNQ